MIEALRQLPIELRPRLRVFLSADLVGSTALKQAERFPLSDPSEAQTARGGSPHWLDIISSFYADFSMEFERAWTIWDADTDFGEASAAPEFWKANGDELIFVKEIRDRLDLFKTIFAWRSAVDGYSKGKTLGRRLGVKTTIWVAGFPLANSEIIISSGLRKEISKYSGDPRLQLSENLAIWYKNKASRKNFVRDFIGPQIDVGFRLSTQSSIRYSVISIDVAYLLSTATPPLKDGKKFSDLKIVYLGKRELKGVLSGTGYPLFAMDLKDVLPNETHDFDEEDELTGKKVHKSNEDVGVFCKKFYDVKNAFIFPPFIVDCTYEHTRFPIQYLETLQSLEMRLKNERERTKSDEEGDRLGHKSAADQSAISQHESPIIADVINELKKLVPEV